MARRTHRRAAWLVLLAAVSLVTGSEAQRAPNTLTDAERKAGWQLLFDGRTLAGWHRHDRGSPDGGWKVIDGAITRVGPAGDLVSDRRFGDFELIVEWKISPTGNSGIFYRAMESGDPLFHSGPEYQILDDAGNDEGRSPLTSAGACYGLYPVTDRPTRPAGEWNEARIVVDGNSVEHWLNGVKVLVYSLGSPSWRDRVSRSKFAAWSEYGAATDGVIGLQDHFNWVAFRSIRIRPIR